MKAKSIKGKSTAEIQASLSQSMLDGFRPTLSIVFISLKQDRDAVSTLLHEKGMDVIGATSSGEFINNHQSQGEIVILLLDIPREYYTLIYRETSGKQLEDVVREATEDATSKIKNPGYIVATTCLNAKGELFEGTRLVHTIEKYSGPTTDIFGGMAGADAELIPSFVFTTSQTTNEGFVMLVLDRDKIEMYGVAISGWKPLGKIRTVTRCENGWLYEIDDQPVLDMYLRYLGESPDQKNEEDKVFLDTISLFYPFLCLDDVDPEIRTPMFVDKEKNAIMLDYPIPRRWNISIYSSSRF